VALGSSFSAQVITVSDAGINPLHHLWSCMQGTLTPSIHQ